MTQQIEKWYCQICHEEYPEEEINSLDDELLCPLCYREAKARKYNGNILAKTLEEFMKFDRRWIHIDSRGIVFSVFEKSPWSARFNWKWCRKCGGSHCRPSVDELFGRICIDTIKEFLGVQK